MIIDSHTHTFPDKIAAQTIEFLSKKGNIKPYREGTLSSLVRSMRQSGIDYSVVLPVATSPKQVENINATSAELSGRDGVFFAGAIHPDCENIDEILDKIKDYGFFGIKIHPDYQGVYFDDERYIKIMRGAAERGLITVTHAGVDVGFPDDVRCTPDRILNVLDKLCGIIDNKLVLAHLGGYAMADEVLEKLIGKPVYMDTAAVLSLYPEKCLQIIKAHGADRIMFATDSPWADQGEYLEIIKNLGLSEKELQAVLSGTAQRLFNIC